MGKKEEPERSVSERRSRETRRQRRRGLSAEGMRSLNAASSVVLVNDNDNENPR